MPRVDIILDPRHPTPDDPRVSAVHHAMAGCRLAGAVRELREGGVEAEVPLASRLGTRKVRVSDIESGRRRIEVAARAAAKSGVFW